MVDTAALLAAYDAHMRMPTGTVPSDVTYEHDGPILRIVGEHVGRIRAPRDVGVTGAALDRLIARQRDYFQARGQGVEWKLRAHDVPADLPERLVAAGFAPQDRSAVLLGFAEEVAAVSTARCSPPGPGRRPPVASGCCTSMLPRPARPSCADAASTRSPPPRGISGRHRNSRIRTAGPAGANQRPSESSATGVALAGNEVPVRTEQSALSGGGPSGVLVDHRIGRRLCRWVCCGEWVAPCWV
jgi:hypothetical protein